MFILRGFTKTSPRKSPNKEEIVIESSPATVKSKVKFKIFQVQGNNEDDDHIYDSNLCLSFESIQTCDYSALRALNTQKL